MSKVQINLIFEWNFGTYDTEEEGDRELIEAFKRPDALTAQSRRISEKLLQSDLFHDDFNLVGVNIRKEGI